MAIKVARADQKITQVDLAVRILKYLQTNPQAKDTVEGIAEWWLIREMIDEAIENVEDALQYLLQKDLIREEMLSDRTMIYKLNPEKINQIMAYIKEHESEKTNE